jgi:hypothetical protein
MVFAMKYSIYFALLRLENQNKRYGKKKSKSPLDDLLRTRCYIIK